MNLHEIPEMDSGKISNGESEMDLEESMVTETSDNLDLERKTELKTGKSAELERKRKDAGCLFAGERGNDAASV